MGASHPSKERNRHRHIDTHEAAPRSILYAFSSPSTRWSQRDLEQMNVGREMLKLDFYALLSLTRLINAMHTRT